MSARSKYPCIGHNREFGSLFFYPLSSLISLIYINPFKTLKSKHFQRGMEPHTLLHPITHFNKLQFAHLFIVEDKLVLLPPLHFKLKGSQKSTVLLGSWMVWNQIEIGWMLMTKKKSNEWNCAKGSATWLEYLGAKLNCMESMDHSKFLLPSINVTDNMLEMNVSTFTIDKLSKSLTISSHNQRPMPVIARDTRSWEYIFYKINHTK